MTAVLRETLMRSQAMPHLKRRDGMYRFAPRSWRYGHLGQPQLEFVAQSLLMIGITFLQRGKTLCYRVSAENQLVEFIKSLAVKIDSATDSLRQRARSIADREQCLIGSAQHLIRCQK